MNFLTAKLCVEWKLYNVENNPQSVYSQHNRNFSRDANVVVYTIWRGFIGAHTVEIHSNRKLNLFIVVIHHTKLVNFRLFAVLLLIFFSFSFYSSLVLSSIFVYIQNSVPLLIRFCFLCLSIFLSTNKPTKQATCVHTFPLLLK